MNLVLIALGLTVATLPVAAQSNSMENLPNGRYLFCDNPPPNDGFSVVNCFDFQKTNTQFIGYYFPTNVKYATVCISGKSQKNVINGEAVYLVRDIDRGAELTLAAKFQGNELKAWDGGNSGRLKVARAIAGNGTVRGYRTPLVKFRSIELQLNGFKRYELKNVRTMPKTCTNWT